MLMSILQRHQHFWKQASLVFSASSGVLLLIASLVANHFANSYTANHANTVVGDLFLDNIPVVDIHLIYSEGAVLFLLILVAVLLYEPRSIPFTLKAIALFVAIRSFFIILTHLAPPANELVINPNDYIQELSSGDDLFFSAHTGLPFLLTAIFWHKKYLNYFFLSCAIVGGTAVILGHIHYSIDVFSALFIAFGIFHMAKFFFFKDYQTLAAGFS